MFLSKKLKIISRILTVTVLIFISACAQSEDNSKADETLQTGTFPLTVVESVPSGTGLSTPGVIKTSEIWKDILRSADETINLGMFYMVSKEGSQIEEIIQIIKEQVAAGVELKVVTDKIFYKKYPEIPDKLDSLKNAEVRIIDLGEIAGGVMHAKYFIVDGRHFYVGSANFDWRSLEHIREIGLAGSSAKISSQLLEIFNRDFTLAGGKDKKRESPSFHPNSMPDYEKLKEAKTDLGRFTLSVSATPPMITPAKILLTEESIIKIINSAQKSIFIDIFQYGLSSSYSPVYYDYIDRALRQAAARGVRIKFMVSDWALSENQQAVLKSLQVMPNIEVRYLAIPEAEEGHISFARVSHTKLLIADGKTAWTGSANWQPGYFNESRNVGIITGKNELVQNLTKFFNTAWKSSYARYLELDKTYSPPRRQ